MRLQSANNRSLRGFDRGCWSFSSIHPKPKRHPWPGCNGSVLIIVLWVALGLVSITLYFANAMTLELRAADNRVSGLAADQALEGGARYVKYLLSTLATNGAVPDVSTYQSEAVP